MFVTIEMTVTRLQFFIGGTLIKKVNSLKSLVDQTDSRLKTKLSLRGPFAQNKKKIFTIRSIVTKILYRYVKSKMK